MVPSGLWLSVVSNFTDQMVTGDSEIWKEYVPILIFLENRCGKQQEIR